MLGQGTLVDVLALTWTSGRWLAAIPARLDTAEPATSVLRITITVVAILAFVENFIATLRKGDSQRGVDTNKIRC